MVLGHLYAFWDREWSGPGLREATGVAQAVVSRELARLGDCGLIRRRRVGNTLLVQADPTTPMFDPLRRVLMLAYGPIPTLSALLVNRHEIEQAVIVGAWAHRWQGTPGQWPDAIDVVVVIDAELFDLTELAVEAEQRLGIPVNVIPVSSERWDAPDAEPWVEQARCGPTVPLDLPERPVVTCAHEDAPTDSLLALAGRIGAAKQHDERLRLLIAFLDSSASGPVDIDIEPAATGRPEWDAALAAAAELVARHRGSITPVWAGSSSRFLKRWWFPVEDALGRLPTGLAVYAFAHSPGPFAARGIMLDAETLASV